MLRPALRTALALGLLVSSLRAARAEDTPTTPLVELDRGRARAHFERGRALFEREDYAQALGEFRSALELVPAPALEYNVGLSLERLYRFTDAVAAYRRFLDARPNDAAAPAVRARMEALDAGIKAAEAKPAVVEGTHVSVAPPSRVAPAVVGGVALGLAVIGGGLLGHAAVEAGSRSAGCCADSEISLLRGQAYAG